jgi:hypothetical protein
MKTVGLQERVITLSDVETAVRDGATGLTIGEAAILTPSAREAVELRRIAVRIGSTSRSASGTVPAGVD